MHSQALSDAFATEPAVSTVGFQSADNAAVNCELSAKSFGADLCCFFGPNSVFKTIDQCFVVFFEFLWQLLEEDKPSASVLGIQELLCQQPDSRDIH